MEYCDILFPLNIGPLTYSVPDNLAGHLRPGMIVVAEVKKSIKPGIALGRSVSPPKGRIKSISGIVSAKEVLSSSLLSLLQWLSGYYMITPGLALKSIFPLDIFEKHTKSTKPSQEDTCNNMAGPFDIHLLDESGINDIASMLEASASNSEYKTHLFHAPSIQYEISCAIAAAKKVKNSIILVPETTTLEIIAPILRKECGERLVVLHGKLTNAQKRTAYEKMLSGESDIVVGTRIAAFAPLKRVSLMTVLQEHNPSYKNLEGLRYNARDVAVMRSYIEKSTVLLSSTTPSIESFYNTTSGKYTFIRHNITFPLPKVEILNMRSVKKITPYLSKRAIDASKACVNSGRNVIFLINRKGYSMVQCEECGHIETCLSCKTPLVYHKDKKIMKCHHCDYVSKLGDMCERCKSPKLAMTGAGTQRIASDIGKLLAIEPLRADKDCMQGSSALSEAAHNERIIVGTKIMTNRLLLNKAAALSVFLNPDTKLHSPDFRSAERLFQEMWSLSEQTAEDGRIIVQTRMPETHVYRHFRKHNFELFYKEELLSRKTLSYPPFSRLALITITSKDDITDNFKNAVKAAEAGNGQGVEAIGPIKTIVKGKGTQWNLIVKSTAKVRLHIFIHKLLKPFEKNKKVKIITDVDPISL